MINRIDAQTLDNIKNPVFRSYASVYVDIYRDFLEEIQKTGIQIDPQSYDVETAENIERLMQKGAIVRNGGKSIFVTNISPACVACQKGTGSATFFISLRCHRDCFYCFNPNQEGYDHFKQNERDLIKELDQIKSDGFEVQHLALTGGEPLLHKDQAVDFFRHAHKKFPSSYSRLYTSGDHIDEEILQQLKDANLDEIRFSVRLYDLEKGNWHTLDRIASAREYIPFVMVEMPVLPGALDLMKELLRKLDQLKIYSVNLLEFCYPYFNTDVFNHRSYAIKKYPYRILYNYWYAGGLPVSKSELDCLDLLEYAVDEKFDIGVHYCSLENKHTGQIYQSNRDQSLSETTYFSKKDYFLKTAKVFGDDIPIVRNQLIKARRAKFLINKEHDYLEFHVRNIKSLEDLDVEIGISSSVMETREDGTYFRELTLDLCYPEKFEFSTDV